MKILKLFIVMTLLLSSLELRAATEAPSGKLLWQSEDGLSLKVFTGAEARAYLEPLAAMRIDFFKEFPYLYQGSLDYESAYLETYFRSHNSAILLVFKGDTLLGFSNIIPLDEEMIEIQSAFSEKGMNLDEYLYIGEVMLDPICRGQGLARRFFEFHEAYAQEIGYSKLVFMTVQRPINHPERPKAYRGLEPIWQHFGYEKLPGVLVKIPWKQIDTGQEEDNTLDIWLKDLEECTKSSALKTAYRLPMR